MRLVTKDGTVIDEEVYNAGGIEPTEVIVVDWEGNEWQVNYTCTVLICMLLMKHLLFYCDDISV